MTTAPDTKSEADRELKQKHRAMWTSGDYPIMVETFLLPLGSRLVEACGIDTGMRVLDVGAGTGNAALRAAAAGAEVVASDLTPRLLEVGRARADDGLALEWREADAEDLPFSADSFDVVMSAIGVMFAPHHQLAADELLRVCRPNGTLGLLSWTPEGMIGDLFRMMGRFAAPPPPGAQPPPLWGSEEHLKELFSDRVAFSSHSRENLQVSAFSKAHDFAEHFTSYYGPAIAVRANAERNDRAAEFDAALREFSERWNTAEQGHAHFELEYLLSVGQKR